MLLHLRNVLYFYISTSHSVYAVPNMAVFCTSLITCFPGMLLRYCRSDFEMVPVTPIINSIILLSHSTCAEFLFWGLYTVKPALNGPFIKRNLP